MGSQVSTFLSVLTMQVSLLILLAMLGITTASTWQAAPYTLFREKRAAQRTRFFTGNNAIDAGAAGAALGVATQYFTNQIFNPCTRGGNRGGTRTGTSPVTSPGAGVEYLVGKILSSNTKSCTCSSCIYGVVTSEKTGSLGSWNNETLFKIHLFAFFSLTSFLPE